MEDPFLHDEAEGCRQLALSFLGRPEASFLLRAARQFDQLAKGSKPARTLNASAPPAFWNTASPDDSGVDRS